jgi:hypothetical protein
VNWFRKDHVPGWVAAGVLVLAAAFWVDRIPVRIRDAAMEAEVFAEDCGAIPIDFEFLERTRPDEDYYPVYPAELLAMEGDTVVLRGFMSPYDDLENLQVFMIFGFPSGCNFCAPPAVNQVVLARQPARSQPYAYVEGPVEVRGRLSLWHPDSTDPALRDDQFLYLMTDVEVKRVSASAFRSLHDFGSHVPGRVSPNGL